MPQIGSFTLLLALAFSSYALIAGIVAIWRRNEVLGETARRAGIAVFVAVTAAAIALVISAFRNDFGVAYIMHHSNRDLPAPYKFAALWSGQEGSLLFWSWLLASYGLVLRVRHKVDTRLVAHASVILSAIQVFFLALVNFAAHPFALVAGTIPPDGNGLNPLLQYPEMVIHPPMLYLGYVGMSVPFAFALAALVMRYPGEKWIHITRRWTMVGWLFLSCGIVLGAHWAYSVLGWGGYWGWDPVENASFLPWLTGTAFLHSVMMQEKRGMMKIWNVWLIFITFLLSIFGTFLTRSGIVSSVHAFAQSGIGPWFSIFMALIGATCIFFFIKNKDHLKSENRLESLVSRESSFLFNNVLLLIFAFAVLWGTLFPILSEAVQGTKITVGPPFFNKVTVPIALALLLLTALGPLLAWRRTSVDSLKRNFLIPTIISVAVGLVMAFGGARPWNDIANFYSVIAVMLSTLVLATVASEFYRGARVIARKDGSNIFAGMVTLTRRNTRRYGGYIVHAGLVLMVIGFAGIAFNADNEKEMGFGDTMQLGPYTLVCKSYSQDSKPNYDSETAMIDVMRGDKFVETMYPERRVYKASEQPATIVANRSTPSADLYLVYTGVNPDTGRPIIKAHLNPLVWWIWAGAHVLLIGTLVALVPNMKPATRALTAAERARSVAEVQKSGIVVAGD